MSWSAQTSANATSYATPPSRVTIAIAWLSPGPGGAGRLNGKTHVGPVPERGDSTTASTGWSAVGSGLVSEAHTVLTDPVRPACSGVLEAASVTGSASWIVPRSYGRI